MLSRVISGGQTGADQAGWRAAKAAGIPTGGWMPLGWLTEDGPRPEFEEEYGAREHPEPGYPPRTEANIRDADATILFGNQNSRGSVLARRICERAQKPYRIVEGFELPFASPHDVARWIGRQTVRSLNVAGNRRSSAPGIEVWAYDYLSALFRLTNPPKPE